ncbi:hypothetical protein SAMN05216420_104131 [Nitrosospira sp. Nl5]|uniref:hypothetical protein n=1 Tax=Nitrosospira sp. Nl5 TaxID=200120 RepID=UPI000889199D|nr:hypothetical protein [Nitrosospira sp. Nl5]SCY29099.1 hypothetical protein SAMN05216420_104131 [Nitrosospira sp. Nl5]
MEKEPLIELPWHGHETIEAVPALLEQAEQIKITLPANYNHALYRALHPEAPRVQLEEIDASGGPELLADIATVSGLEEFTALTDALTAAQATVQVISPPTVIIALPGVSPRV